MNIDILTIEMFILVAETGSFTKASNKIGRTQSAVSQQISKLESSLSVRLFNREKTLTLTHQGEVFLNYARKIFSLNQQVVNELKEPEIEGEISFGLPEDFATFFLSEVLAEFSRTYPKVMINVECDLTLNLLEKFKKNKFDLVLLKMSKPEDFPNGVNIWNVNLEWVASEEFAENFDHKKKIPLVLAPKPCVYRSRAIEALDKANLKYRISYSSPSFAGKLAAVKAGLGVSVIPRNMIPKDLKIIKSLPKLKNSHASLLKISNTDKVAKCFEEFVIKNMVH
ncbi:MAG: LysR substrate-binding domain-containing protein [Rickettsiales bacterium]|nr:LysR substrate-binding domain-containing protein [Rickettsiales bacterium]